MFRKIFSRIFKPSFKDYHLEYRLYINRPVTDSKEFNILYDYLNTIPVNKREYINMTINLKNKTVQNEYNTPSIEFKNRKDIMKFLESVKGDIIDIHKDK